MRSSDWTVYTSPILRHDVRLHNRSHFSRDNQSCTVVEKVGSPGRMRLGARVELSYPLYSFALYVEE